jgi:hypothetical protein
MISKIALLKSPLISVGIISCLLSSAFASAKLSEFQTFRVSKSPAFSKPRTVLRQLIVSEGKINRRNHFCVIGYHKPSELESNGMFAWVYWPEEKAIILWEPSDPKQLPVNELSRSRRFLRMPEDFVKTQDEIKGSTYLETYTWANDLIKECMIKGDRYTFNG